MKKLVTLMIAFSFLLAGCDKEMESLELDIAELKKAGTRNEDPNTFDAVGIYCMLADQTPTDYKGIRQMELWMGVGNKNAGTLIGYVRFESDKVIIDLTDWNQDGIPDMYPYVIEEIHIHFAGDVKGIPQTKKGNPIPGRFEYNITPDEYTTRYEIPVVFEEFGAIHLSVVKFGGIEGFEFYLPNDPVTVEFKYPGPDSYMQMEIISDNAGALKGIYENWCVNTEITMQNYKPYEALLYSSYDEDLPEGLVDYSENLHLVNYLINYYYEGKEVVLKNEDCSDYLVDNMTVSEAITLGDIQKAIWKLIDEEWDYDDLSGPRWTSLDERVFGIVCAVKEAVNALPNKFFKPECNQKIVFLVYSYQEGTQLIVGQPTISSVPVPCADEGGTAWGDGYYGATFGGAQWGTWFKYDATCGE
jgi:hypothetical protein